MVFLGRSENSLNAAESGDSRTSRVRYHAIPHHKYVLVLVQPLLSILHLEIPKLTYFYNLILNQENYPNAGRTHADHKKFGGGLRFGFIGAVFNEETHSDLCFSPVLPALYRK